MWFWKSLKLCFILGTGAIPYFGGEKVMEVCGLTGEYGHETLTSTKCERGGKAGWLWHSGILFDGGKGITVAGVLWVWWDFLFFLRCLLQTPEVQLFVVREIFGMCSLKARRHFTLLCITFNDLCVGTFAHEEKSFLMVSTRLPWPYVPAMLPSPTDRPSTC